VLCGEEAISATGMGKDATEEGVPCGNSDKRGGRNRKQKSAHSYLLTLINQLGKVIFTIKKKELGSGSKVKKCISYDL